MTIRPKKNILGMSYDDFVKSFTQLSKRGDYFTRPVYKQVMLEGLFKPQELLVFQESPKFLKIIEDNYYLKNLDFQHSLIDGDTEKIAFKTFDNHIIESVSITMKGYKTLCISSQVGCKMGCKFCETTKLGFTRNLLANEIVSQVHYMRNIKKDPIRNIVFMGMGEPLDNWKEVSKAIDIFVDDYGFNFKRTHITVSTCGLCDKIDEITNMKNSFFYLAISLNAATNEIRNKIMPINKKYNLQTLQNSIINYIDTTNKEIMLEYVLIKDVNDSILDAQNLIKYCKKFKKIKINLIPYNPVPHDKMQPPDFATKEAFFYYLLDHNIITLNRVSKGDKIMAACGQLAAKYNPKKDKFFN